MSTRHDGWRTPHLTTTIDLAAACYRQGVAALVAGAGHAIPSLEAAVAADPGFHLAHVALAAARMATGEPFDPPAPPGGLTRAERHHVEVLDEVCRGDVTRAADLRREHLLDYPGDLLVVWVPLLRLFPSPPVPVTRPR